MNIREPGTDSLRQVTRIIEFLTIGTSIATELPSIEKKDPGGGSVKLKLRRRAHANDNKNIFAPRNFAIQKTIISIVNNRFSAGFNGGSGHRFFIAWKKKPGYVGNDCCI